MAQSEHLSPENENLIRGTSSGYNDARSSESENPLTIAWSCLLGGAQLYKRLLVLVFKETQDIWM